MRSFFYWLVQEVSIFTWIVTIALDFSWNLFDGLSFISVVGIICSPLVMGVIFTVCFITVTLIQHFISGDEWKTAMNKGVVFGVLAALPFSIISLIAGALGLTVRNSRSQEYTQAIGELTLNYRELEKTIKHAAINADKRISSWREMPMETAINTLEQAEGFRGDVLAEAERGSVRLLPDGPVAAAIKASASYDNVRLQVPGGSRFELDASADPGDVSVSVPGLSLVEQSQQSVRGRLGEGGPHVELRSRHGDVKLTEVVGGSSVADDEDE